MLQIVNSSLKDENNEPVKEIKTITKEIKEINNCVESIVQVWINRKIFDVESLEKFKEEIKETGESCDQYIESSSSELTTSTDRSNMLKAE